MAITVDPNIKIPLVEYTAANAATLKSRPKFNLHTVKPGESFQQIATLHGIPYPFLLEANLSYNLATLTKKNPDLAERISRQNGQDIQRVPVTIEPGQTILVPVTWRNKNTQHNREVVYGLNVPTAKMDDYSSDKKNPEELEDLLNGLRRENTLNDERERERQEHTRVSTGLITAKEIYVDQLPTHLRDSKKCDINKDQEPYPCHRFYTRIGEIESLRDGYLNRSGASYDLDGDGWFSPAEYGALITALETQFPLP